VGTTGVDGADTGAEPTPLLAVVVKVYDVPGVSPVITQEVAGGVTVHVWPPGLAVTVYDVTVPPLTGGVTVSTAQPGPETALGGPGLPGAASLTGADGIDVPEVPETLVAVDTKVYVPPRVRPLTTQDVAGGVTVHVCPPGTAVTA
jgi:hypothetical protein